jgi:23S rRNA (uracil1939-C5)-methyltransferase
MSTQLYTTWKRGIVVSAFAREDMSPVIGPLVRVAPASRRRATFSTVRAAGARRLVGFHARASHDVIALEACAVLTPRIESGRAALAELASTLPGVTAATRLAVADLGTGIDVDVQGLELTVRTIGPDLRARLGDIARRNGLIRLSLGGEVLIEFGRATLPLAGAAVPLPPGAFFQAVAEAEQAIVAAVEGALPKRARAIADLFSGIGTLTLPLARRARVLAVDNDARSLEALAAAARRTVGAKPIETRRRDLFKEPLSAKELEPFDVVVVDPPRAGARAQAERLARSKVRHVVMVSCAPQSLARDARILVEGGFELERVTPIDQFIWSGHIEAVAVFSR